MSVDKNVPAIRFKGFSGGWAENYLGGLIDIRSAARVHKEQWTADGVPFFRTSDVVSIYKGKDNTKAYISHEVYQGLSDKIGKVEKDDLLITGGGSIGIPYLVPNDDPLYFKDADLLWLKNNKKFDGNFFYTFFFSEPFKKHIKSISHIGTIAHYTIEQAKATPINTCDDKEQTKIGNTFQKLDSLISQHQQKHDKLSSIKKSMLEKMFPKQGKTIPEIRFKGFNGEWDEKELGDVSRIKTGSSNREDSGLDGEYTFFDRSEDIRASNIFLFNCEAVIVAGEGSDFIPKYFVGKFDLHQRTYAIMEFDNCDGKYLFYYIHLFRKHFLDQAVGSTVKSLRLPMFEEMPIKVPEKEEQTAIGNYFQKLDALINQHQQQIIKLNNIKQACLSKMFV